MQMFHTCQIESHVVYCLVFSIMHYCLEGLAAPSQLSSCVLDSDCTVSTFMYHSTIIGYEDYMIFNVHFKVFCGVDRGVYIIICSSV